MSPIDHICEELGISPAELARRLGVSRQVVNTWKHRLDGYPGYRHNEQLRKMAADAQVNIEPWLRQAGRCHCCGRPF